MAAWVTLADFRAARNMTAKRYAALVRAGDGPILTTVGGVKGVTAESARVWDIEEGGRLLAALTFAAELRSDALDAGQNDE